MLEYLKQEVNKTFTENGAVTYASTGSDCLDLFATIGALRNQSDEEIIARFIRAYTENADAAMKLLFYARDIRGGLGERRVFRKAFGWLAANKPASVKKNIKYVADFGRYDDLLSLMGTPCEKYMLAFIKNQFEQDMASLAKGEGVSLLGKWLPSVNASNVQTVLNAKKVAKAFNMNDAAYRKAVSALRAKIQIIENYLRESDYSFDYEKQPSRALYKYKQAFLRNDASRYNYFIDGVLCGSTKMHADNVAPYELVEPYLPKKINNISYQEKAVLNATWSSLPDYCNNENALAVIDTSGSMYWPENPSPAAVAISLGLYIAERNKGIFKNHFIEFSNKPHLIELKGNSFCERLRYISTFNEIADTNLEAVFELILNAAVKHNVKQSELPAKLIIISDMEFNECVTKASETVFENAKRKYAANGYKLPQVVFWNVESRNRQQPVTMNERGVALVSGVTPKIFAMVAGGIVSPYQCMMEILGGKRYAEITA